MTFRDIFKSNFLNSVTSVSVIDMLIAILLAFLIGMLILFVYRKTFSGVMYSSSFSITLVALTMITTVVMLAVTSNVILSLGMVGALSIVRFRTAIKEPMDIAFLFWSITVGIVLAAGMIPLAVIGSILIGVFMLVFANAKPVQTPYLVVIKCENQESEGKARLFLKRKVKKIAVKSKTVQKGFVELTLEVRLHNDDTAFVNELTELEGVTSAVLVSYNGEYVG